MGHRYERSIVENAVFVRGPTVDVIQVAQSRRRIRVEMEGQNLIATKIGIRTTRYKFRERSIDSIIRN